MLRKLNYILSLVVLLALAIHAKGSGHSVSLELTQLKCYNVCDGKAKALVTGATGPVVIHWYGDNLAPNTKGDSILGLCPGNYAVEVIDKADNSSSGIVFFEILNASPLFLYVSESLPTCYGEDDGVLSISVSGGMPPYTYLWSTSITDTLNSVDSLIAGQYSVLLTDSTGCTLRDTFLLTEPDSLIANVQVNNAKCKNQCSGSALAQPIGGTSPFQYFWSNADTTALAENLCDGNYNLIVTDKNGCLAFDTIDILEPDSLLTTLTIDSAICQDSCNGKITPVVSGGTNPYFFNWSPGNTSDSVLMNACSGNYTFTVSDSNGCFVQENLTVLEPLELTIVDSIDQPDCNVCNGLIKVTPSGGSGSYRFLWNTGNPADTLGTLSGICAGVYEVTIKDSLNCERNFTFHLSDSSNFTGLSAITINPTCISSNNGSATIRPIGGTAPFTYSWLPGLQTDSTIFGLGQGRFTAEVTDNSGCKQLKLIDLTAPPSINFNAEIHPEKCINSCDGEIILRPTGGTPPYAFNWLHDLSKSASASKLCSGWYKTELTDAGNCTILDSFFVDSARTIQLSVQSFNTGCFGSCSGYALPIVSGGQAPFSFEWSNNTFGDSATSLCSGDYSLKAVDANGCSSTATFSISDPSPIQANFSVVNSNCNTNDGKIFLNPSGGSGGYRYFWFNGSKKDSLVGLAAGFYNVDIIDNSNCLASFTIPISNDDGPKIGVSVQNERCIGSCDGNAAVNISFGQGPYTFMWSNGDTTATVSGLCSGIYYVKVTDGNNCATVQQIEILKPTEMNVQISTTDQTCDPLCDGNAIATVSGGVPPYQFNWSAGGALNAINNLCPGIQTLTVTDSENCSQITQFEIKSYDPIQITFNTKNVSCSNLCDGEAKAVINGGKAPFQYIWSNGARTSTSTSLCTGNYDLTIIDANGCTNSASFIIGNKTPVITLQPTITNATCGLCDGMVQLSANGGNGAPFKFYWQGSMLSGNSISDICAGTYVVRAEDNTGCSQDFVVNVQNTGGPTLSDSIVNVSCFGLCDGKAIITPVGKAPFSFFWNDSLQQQTDTAKNLCAGNYTVLVSDSDRCISISTITLSTPSQIINQFSYGAIACPGDSGSISALVSGGVPPYSYLWSTGANDTLNAIDSLPSGNYFLTITDSSLCSILDTAILSDPNSISIAINATPVLCFGACNGTANATVNGGSAPYSFQWNDVNLQTDQRAIGLCSGKYLVTVTDANGCSATDSIILTAPPSINLSSTPSNPTCLGGDDGSISISPAGGAPPYRYVWNDGQKTNPAIGLQRGRYSVIVIDNNGCTAYDTILLNDPTGLSATFNRIRPDCDSANGSIQAIPSGGSGNYSYNWLTVPVRTTASATDLPAGTYPLVITDNTSGCEVAFNVILNNTSGPTLTLSPIAESCFGACNGSIAATATSIVSYEWNDPAQQVSPTAIGLCSGTYSVTVTDTGGCKTTDTASIQTTFVSVTATSITSPSCFGDCDGEAMVMAAGGRIPYSYNWNTTPSQSGATAVGLCAGTYLVTAADSANCEGLGSVTLSNPTELKVTASAITPFICNSSCDGRAEALVSGGSGPFIYQWSGGANTKLASGLCQGFYVVVVTDARGCTASDSVEIKVYSPIILNPITIRPNCGLYDGSILLNPSGGMGPYSYSWSNGALTAFNDQLFAGIYSVIVTDNRGCSREQTFFLNNPNAPLLSFGNNNVSCQGDCNGIATVIPSGGVAPYQYLWDYTPLSFNDSLFDLCSGAYSVKVTDAVGCISFGNDTIREPELLVVNPVVDDPGCGGLCLGIATANPSGGTLPYRYSWNTVPASTTNTVEDLCAGAYVVTVTDTNDCVATANLSLVPPPALVVDSITSVPASCNENADGQAAVYISGGSPPYSYFWNDGNISQTIPNTRGGVRIVQVTDDNGCIILDTVIVGVLDTVTVEAIDDFSACFGQEIELSSIGSGVVSYQWFEVRPASIEQVGNDSIITVILADTTIFILRGSNSSNPACVDRDTVLVTAIPSPIVSAGPDQTILKGESTILDDVSPFIAQGFYFWNPGSGLDDSTVIRPRANPDETTTYILTVIDEFGCFGSDTLIVFVADQNRIFNGISPNGDGVNDVWTIELIEDYPNAIVEVYNRWGQQVFRSEGYKEKWDGTYDGEALPPGTYYYVIDLQVAGTELLTGPITILR